MLPFSEFLHIKWSISRAADTAGYNRVTLTPTVSPGRHVAVGGGYDMVGTVVADYLSATFKEQFDKAAANYRATSTKPPYGFFLHAEGGWRLDGGCGLDSIIRAAALVNIKINALHGPMNRRRNRELLGFDVSYSGD